jgi:hypothetical protein
MTEDVSINHPAHRRRELSKLLSVRKPCDNSMAWHSNGIVLCNNCMQQLMRKTIKQVGLMDELMPGMHRSNKTCMFTQ